MCGDVPQNELLPAESTHLSCCLQIRWLWGIQSAESDGSHSASRQLWGQDTPLPERAAAYMGLIAHWCVCVWGCAQQPHTQNKKQKVRAVKVALSCRRKQNVNRHLRMTIILSGLPQLLAVGMWRHNMECKLFPVDERSSNRAKSLWRNWNSEVNDETRLCFFVSVFCAVLG